MAMVPMMAMMAMVPMIATMAMTPMMAMMAMSDDADDGDVIDDKW